MNMKEKFVFTFLYKNFFVLILLKIEIYIFKMEVQNIRVGENFESCILSQKNR